MKKSKSAAALFALTLAAAICVSASTMSVQVRDAAVRSSPSFVGKIVGRLAYADRVETGRTQGPWLEISAPGSEGWVHASALSSRRIVLASGREQAAVSASGDELALAGKGFNSEVESRFKARNGDIDFSWINRIEKTRVSPEEITDFLNRGGLRPMEGGVK